MSHIHVLTTLASCIFTRSYRIISTKKIYKASPDKSEFKFALGKANTLIHGEMIVCRQVLVIFYTCTGSLGTLCLRVKGHKFQNKGTRSAQSRKKDVYSEHRSFLEGRIIIFHRSVKLATSSQLLVAGYLFRENLASSSQLLATGYLQLTLPIYFFTVTGIFLKLKCSLFATNFFPCK